jgi:hypothetical protein
MSAKPRSKLSPKLSREGRPRGQSSHLKIAVNSDHPRRGPSGMKWLAVFVSLGLMSYAWMVGRSYLSSPDGLNAVAAISNLGPAFQNDGIEGYLLAKARLRDQVRTNLRLSPTDSNYAQAENIAVYLFPNLLPETHFEKSESLFLFAPEIELIESRPRSEQAQAAYERLTLEIWNYENISREEPRISDAAIALLEMLQKLSQG